MDDLIFDPGNVKCLGENNLHLNEIEVCIILHVLTVLNWVRKFQNCLHFGSLFI